MSIQRRDILRLRWILFPILFVVGLGLFGLARGGMPVAAAASSATSLTAAAGTTWSVTQPISNTRPTDDAACRQCHSDTASSITFPSGETLPAQVNLDALDTSAHGQHAEADLSCTACHAPARYQFPHPPVEAPDLRTYQLNQSLTCERCHQLPHLTSHPGADSETPVACTDCHGAHDIQVKEAWYEGEGVETCVACHQTNDVPTANQADLTHIIQNGLFSTQTTNNIYCTSCHSLENLSLTLANGDTLDLTVTQETLAHSVHGEGNEWQPLDCVNCHEGYIFPHPEVTAQSAREYALEKYPVCADCHEPKYEEAQDSVHAIALEEGKLEAAVCTDCHGAHDTPVPDVPRSRISQTCRQCHSDIFDEYSTSVHGEALLNDDNQDVPTCVECHGVHNINDPTTALFRVRSPQLCAGCHADEALMAQYDISTDVFSTYVSDFHGTTVTLFEHQDPTVETNKAVCYDCHGVHDIHRPDDPEAGIKDNLLETCRQCHPDATENFPDSWTSHFRPSLENNPLVFLVNSFYWVVIPGTLGFFGFLVLTDMYRRIIARRH